MKFIKSIFISALFLICTAVFAQSDTTLSASPTSKGKVILGGSSNFNFASQKSKIKSDDFDDIDQGTNTSFSIMPSAGYFIIEDLAIGAGISFSTNRFKNDNSDFKSTQTAIAFSPFVRYYFGGDTMKPFVQGSIGFGSLKVDDNSVIFGDDIASSDVKVSTFEYNFNGGVAFFLNDLGVGYTSASFKNKDNNDNNVRNINNNIGFNAGFHIFL